MHVDSNALNKALDCLHARHPPTYRGEQPTFLHIGQSWGRTGQVGRERKSYWPNMSKYSLIRLFFVVVFISFLFFVFLCLFILLFFVIIFVCLVLLFFFLFVCKFVLYFFSKM